MPLEIATFTLSSALLALKSGAQRIELCSHKNKDGLTPDVKDFISISSSLFQSSYSGNVGRFDVDDALGVRGEGEESKREVGEEVKGEINIMIRPHDNSTRGTGPDEDFRVGDEVFDRMKEEIRMFREAGGRGFVFGILKDSDGDEGKGLVIDTERCAELIRVAREGEGGEKVRCTFHRAFDRIESSRMGEQLEILVSLSFTAILTSGSFPTATQGIPQIARLAQQAAGRIDIIVGGGVRSQNLRQLMDGTGARWFHSSAVMGEGEEVDVEEVGRLRAILGDVIG
ncbi:hypothetical protein NHQ30_001164 [Ciborinia camelliae]|nr:hypothetical protein NHQ30_001164 [Ciborinia camelliae]